MNLTNRISETFTAPPTPSVELMVFELEGRFPEQFRRICEAASYGDADRALLEIHRALDPEEHTLETFVRGTHETANRQRIYGNEVTTT